MMTTPAPDNFFAFEQLLVTRLQAQLADISPRVKIITSADLAGITEAQQVTPAVQVIYRGYRVQDVRTDGRAARFEQTWLTVVATRNVASLRSGDAARLDAGVIALRVLKALMGHTLPGSSRPLRPVDAPEAAYSAGFMYLPLAFAAELAITNPI